MSTADDKVAWMRERGVIQAQWSVDGDVTMLLLGPERFPQVGPQDSDDKKNDEPSIEDMLLASA
jgi:hypothetical protein